MLEATDLALELTDCGSVLGFDCPASSDEGLPLFRHQAWPEDVIHPCTGSNAPQDTKLAAT